MKIFVAGIATETNTFAPAPTGLAAFAEHGLWRGDIDNIPAVLRPQLAFLRQAAQADGHELAFGLSGFAQPGGATVQSVWEELRDTLLADLRRQLPVDAVILPLHGAMVAQQCLDCEGELIERVRGLVGPQVPIGVELDLHCHLTERMVRQADVIVAFKEYPHIDIVDRLAEVWRLTLAIAAGRIRPVTEVFDCRMINFWHTTREPMRGFVERMKAVEQQPGVLSVSFGHGFPYGDTPDTTAKLWVVTDADRPLAAKLAETLGREVFAMRRETMQATEPLDVVLDRMLAATQLGRPVVVADRADNAGGGAASDSTFILRRLVERGIGNVAVGAFFDLGAIHTCREAGLGAELRLRIGGKSGPASGDPLDLDVTVRAIAEHHEQGGLAGSRSPCGPSVWVATAEGLDVVLISVRQQVTGLSLFTGLGIDLASKQAVVVKSSQHFHAEFAPIASAVLYADTPGLLRADFERIPYSHRDGCYWPRVDDPWAANSSPTGAAP